MILQKHISIHAKLLLLFLIQLKSYAFAGNVKCYTMDCGEIGDKSDGADYERGIIRLGGGGEEANFVHVCTIAFMHKCEELGIRRMK